MQLIVTKSSLTVCHCKWKHQSHVSQQWK